MQTIYYNPGHNILELCEDIAQSWFATSKTKIDI